MDRQWADLVRFTGWELGDADAARDVVQEAFVHLWRHRRSWVSGGSPRAYLFRIVHHQILDEHRRKRVRAAWATRQASLPSSTPPDPGQLLDAARVQAAFEQALASLPRRRREAFGLVVLRGLTHGEAAAVMDVSEQTVANQVSAALRELRQALRAVSDLVP